MSVKIEITLTFDAPRDIVFKMFSEAEHLRLWWGPRGWDFGISSFEFRQGGVFHYSQKSPEGEVMWVKFVYDEVIVPQKLVYTYFFSDEAGNVVRAPFHDSWPLKTQNTFTFEEDEGKTIFTMIGTPISATEEELKTFDESRDMIYEGFSGTFDILTDYLTKVNGKKTTITVETTVHKPVEKVWKYWTEPRHITKWCYASDDWHAPNAENDLRVGGRFVTRMEAKDGSFGFDFGGVYNEVRINEFISYTIEDGRKVAITFIRQENDTKVIETFEAEATNSIEMQQAGWQAIMDNFKKYSESSKEN